jgi:RNA polymerase sigma-70 factor (ECF subfamily)
MVSAKQSELSFVDRLEGLMPQLRAFARGLCRDKVLADDLVQEACLKAWSSMDSFNAEQPMRPWMFRILRNEYYMQMRRAWRDVQVEPEFVETSLVADGMQEISQDFSRMEKLINSLPDNQRDALILVLAAGMTYEEAGEVCGCSAGTIKSRVSRARETVKTRFDSHERVVHSVGADAASGMSALLNRIDEITNSVLQAA